MRTISTGDILDGRYEILGLLGQGGMGSVFKARQIKLDRIVALKVPNARVMADAVYMKRFEREARTCARLAHDNIVTIYDVMVTEELAYISMEYVDGDPLDQFLAKNFSVLSVADVVDLIGQVCGGLDYAHKRGIVHRDVKPSNIFVTREGRRAKIMDFGIARVSDATALTVDGSVLGTPYYMAPEQIRGEAVGPASDIYALTIVIYKIFTNRLVFDGELTVLIYKHVSEPPTPPRRVNPRLPEDLDECLLRGLEKDPRRRYQSALELFDRLREATVPIGHLALSEVVPPPSGETFLYQATPVAPPESRRGEETPGSGGIFGPSGTAAVSRAGGDEKTSPRERPVAMVPGAPTPADLAERETKSFAGERDSFERSPAIAGAGKPLFDAAGGREAKTGVALAVAGALARGLWYAVRLGGRGFLKLPRWAKAAAVFLPAAVVLGYFYLPTLGVGDLKEKVKTRLDSGDLLPKVSVRPAAKPLSAKTKGDEESPARASVVEKIAPKFLQPAKSAKDGLLKKARGVLAGRKEQPLAVSIEFTKAPRIGRAGKLYRIEWKSSVPPDVVLECYLLSLDGEKPLRISPMRPYYSWSNLPPGKHSVVVRAESRDGRRSAPAAWEFEILP